MTITKRQANTVLMSLIAGTFIVSSSGGDPALETGKILWQDPTDLENRDLLYGPGGKKDQPPSGPFEFVKEDLSGTNPKFTVRDPDGVKWKVKLGAEAKPETVATRFVWAVGYSADEDYFVERAQITNVPKTGLKRLKGLISSDSTVRNVRFKREEKGDKKEGNWAWNDPTLSGSRELNGLRVLMSVLNNWDLKDENNKVHDIRASKDESKKDESKDESIKAEAKDESIKDEAKKHEAKDKSEERVNIVSDLGASFGTTNYVTGLDKSRGNLKNYEHSRFITRKTADTVDFATPGRPTLLEIFNPRQYFARVRLEWIGRNIPRADAKWMGTLLGRLSPAQIRDAFRSAGYSPADVESFARVMESRIAELNAL